MRTRSINLFLISVLAAATLSGCATTSHVMVGTAHPPISPSDVLVYMRPPAKYAEIAILESSSRNSFSFTAQGKTDKVMERLKIEAAKLGANGILMRGIVDQQSGSIGTGFGSGSASGNSAFGVGFGTSAALYQKQGSAVAIFVETN